MDFAGPLAMALTGQDSDDARRIAVLNKLRLDEALCQIPVPATSADPARHTGLCLQDLRRTPGLSAQLPGLWMAAWEPSDPAI